MSLTHALPQVTPGILFRLGVGVLHNIMQRFFISWLMHCAPKNTALAPCWKGPEPEQCSPIYHGHPFFISPHHDPTERKGASPGCNARGQWIIWLRTDRPFRAQKARFLYFVNFPSFLPVLCRHNAANIRPRSLGIVFCNLCVVGVTAANSYMPTLGSTLNPFSVLEQIQRIRHPSLRPILSGFEGVIKPGEMIRMLSILCQHIVPLSHLVLSCFGKPWFWLQHSAQDFSKPETGVSFSPRTSPLRFHITWWVTEALPWRRSVLPRGWRPLSYVVSRTNYQIRSHYPYSTQTFRHITRRICKHAHQGLVSAIRSPKSHVLPYRQRNDSSHQWRREETRLHRWGVGH